MKQFVKKNVFENRFEFALTGDRVVQLQAMLDDPEDTELDEWWVHVGGLMGFLPDSVASVRWKDESGRVVRGPLPLGQACEVSFTAIAVPVGLPDDLGRGFREWLLAAHPKLVWEIDGQGRLSGTLFHPAAFEEAFDAGRDYVNEQNAAAIETVFGGEPVEWLAALAKTSLPLREIATKSIKLIEGLHEKISAFAAEGPQPPLPADAFITMEIKAKPDDDPVFAVKTQDPRFTPHARITVNGYSFIPTSQWETPINPASKGAGQ